MIIFAAYACKDESGESSIDDFFLNYEITEIAVTSDIPVGAILYNPAGSLQNEEIWTRLTEERIESQGHVGPFVQPVLGQYGLNVDTTGALALQQTIDWGLEARIDFFILPVVREERTRIYPRNIFSEDSAFINLFQMKNDTLPAIELKEMKFALMTDMYGFCSNLNNGTLIETVMPATVYLDTYTEDVRDSVIISRVDQLYAYFVRLSDYFSDPNYYHINGRPVVIMRDPQQLYAQNPAAVYQGIRDAVKQHSGKDIYLIAQQQAWTPPARFTYFFLQGKVDAITMRNMCNVGGGNWDRTYFLPQMINENFKYNREYIRTNFGIDFVPSVSPSYNYYPLSATAYNEPQVPKNPDEFRKYCNVAKMNLGQTPLVIVDAFNNWETDSAIEPTVEGVGNGYGNRYLHLIREQFKK
ncbi:MAG: glycoside hydrolase family 99-like domain-containing protein [Candidatus Symbiothrix sp.]|nr:glycoside hydrolase family 99-like domain-containing protein [Candidatus Symbiothrix sp.]